jgi:hypothetical protein
MLRFLKSEEMTEPVRIVWGVPVTALIVGGFVSLVGWLFSRDFDRRYGRGPK